MTCGCDKWRLIKVFHWDGFPLPIVPKDIRAPIAFIDIHGTNLYEERYYELGESREEAVFVECALYYVDPVVIGLSLQPYAFVIPDEYNPMVEIWKDSYSFNRISVSFTRSDVRNVKQELYFISWLFAQICNQRRMLVGGCLWEIFGEIWEEAHEHIPRHDILTCTVHFTKNSVRLLHQGGGVFVAKLYGPQSGAFVESYVDSSDFIENHHFDMTDKDMKVLFQAPIQACRTTLSSERAIRVCAERL